MCAVTAIPVPEEKPKSIELIKIPLKGDKVRFLAYTFIDFFCLYNILLTLGKSQPHKFLIYLGIYFGNNKHISIFKLYFKLTINNLKYVCY